MLGDAFNGDNHSNMRREQIITAQILAVLLGDDDTFAREAARMARTLADLKKLSNEALYQRYGYLSPGIRFRYQGADMVVLWGDEHIPGYYLAAYDSDGVFERTDSPARVIYCPKSAAFAKRCLRNPQSAAQEMLTDLEYLKKATALMKEYGEAREAADKAREKIGE